MKIAEVPDRNITTPVYRCKECPFAVMGTTRYNWTCGKTEDTIPLSWIAHSCPLPDGEEE